MITFKLFTVIACSGLYAWGGYNWHNARRYLMPILLGGEAGFIAWQNKKKDWWSGLLILPVIGTLCLAYKRFGQGNFARAVWLGLQALVIGLGLFLTGHLAWFLYVPYVIIAAVLAGALNNRVNQIIGDCIFGGWIGVIVFIIQ